MLQVFFFFFFFFWGGGNQVLDIQDFEALLYSAHSFRGLRFEPGLTIVISDNDFFSCL